jgi:PBP1b-binding outer membrane lipoprotein LpoB
MKKVVLSLALVAVMFVSCKEAATEEVVTEETAVEAVEAVEETAVEAILLLTN